jgi:hypothetical protein
VVRNASINLYSDPDNSSYNYVTLTGLEYTTHEWRDGNNKYQLHRENGPAVIHPDGSYEWFLNGKRHRIGGPAVMLYEKGQEHYGTYAPMSSYWVHGFCYSEEEYYEFYPKPCRYEMLEI